MTERIAFWIDMEAAVLDLRQTTTSSRLVDSEDPVGPRAPFRDYKVTMHCPRCGTSLSDHEVSLGFEDDVDDPSVWVRFRHRLAGHPLDDLLAGPPSWPGRRPGPCRRTRPWRSSRGRPTFWSSTGRRGGGAPGGRRAAGVRRASGPSRCWSGSRRAAGRRRVRALFTGIPESEPGNWAPPIMVVDEFVSLEDGTGTSTSPPARGPRHRLEVRAADAAVGGPGRPDAAGPGAARLRRPAARGRPADHPPPARPRVPLPERARPPRLSVLR